MSGGMLAAISGPVELAQTPAKGFDLLLVRGLLPLGQLEGFQHRVHIVQRGAERLNDMVDLFDGLRNGHWSLGLRLAGWWRESFPRLAHPGWGSLPDLVRWRRSNFLVGRDGLGTGWHRLGCPFTRGERLLAEGTGCSPPAASAPTPTASAAWRRSRSSRLLGHHVFRARCFFGSHVCFKLP